MLVHALAILLPFVSAQSTWCGKNYKKNSPVINPGGQFQEPTTSSSTLLNFRCWPRVQPYIVGESSGAIIVDAGLTSLSIPGAQAFNGGSGSLTVRVTAVVNGATVSLAAASMPLNTTGKLIPFDPSVLPASTTPADVSCSATLGSTVYQTSTSVLHLPVPAKGSVTKQDYLTGALLVNTSTNLAGAYKPIIPFGFYTAFDDYLALSPVTIVDNAKQSGRNMIHIVPPFLDNTAAFQSVLNEMEKQGMYLMYDIRDDFQNLTAVQSQVNMMKSYPYLLLWYTADEPDGWSYPMNSTLVAGNLINSLDPYHPVSLVLNCDDYFFETYTQGATILMHDPYPIGINATFSTVWGTPCNATYGDCGCDGCKGNFGDLTTRADLFSHRISVDKRGRSLTAWSVPQAFGVETYWPRYPTPNEFTLETVITLNHGSRGIVPWTEDQNMPSALKSSASVLGGALSTIESMILADGAVFKTISSGAPTGVDVAQWTVGQQILILGGNMGSSNVTRSVGIFGSGASVETIMSLGATVSTSTSTGEVTVSFSALGSIGLVVTTVP